MQNDKTLQFWDDFYSNEQQQQQQQEQQQATIAITSTSNNDDEKDGDSRQNQNHHQQGSEWILKPSNSICKMIHDELQGQIATTNLSNNDNDKIQPNNNNTEILEIGCGSSQFSLYLWEYLMTTQAKQQNEQDDHPKQHPKQLQQQHYCVTATDVSTVCIEQNIQRDTRRIQEFYHQHYKNGSVNQSGTLFQYKVLNVLVEPQQRSGGATMSTATDVPPIKGKFQMVLDKGCFDTFLFRSRKRGGSHHQHHSSTTTTRIQRLLDNIHSWLQNDGIYIILTPRSKITYIRDYKGFANVKRIRLAPGGDNNGQEHEEDNANTIQLGALDGNNNDCEVYMHVCLKNNQYNSSVHHGSANETRRYAFRGQQEASTAPKDTDSCPKCKMTFLEFRKGEHDINQRGIKYWTRTWKGHQTHCKPILC